MTGQPLAAQILQRCIGALEQEDVKIKLHELVRPATDHLYNKLMPYGCIVLIVIFVSFMLQALTFLWVFRVRRSLGVAE